MFLAKISLLSEAGEELTKRILSQRELYDCEILSSQNTAYHSAILLKQFIFFALMASESIACSPFGLVGY